MKTLNFVRYAFITAAVGLFATSSDAAWTYTETNILNNINSTCIPRELYNGKVGVGYITDDNWTFHAFRSIEKNDRDIYVDASRWEEIKEEKAAPINFSEINEGFKVVYFVGVKANSSLIKKYATELVAPECSNLAGENSFVGSAVLTNVTLCATEAVLFRNDRLFQSCTKLVSFTPKKIAGTSLRIEMFNGCSSLEGEFEFPECTSFAKNVFNGCAKLGGIKADNAISVGQSSFAGCASLSNIVLSSNIEKIDVSAFSGTAISAESATKILSASVTSIGKYNSGDDSYKGGCFSGCTAMFGELAWKMPNLATNVVPSECFKNAVLGKIVFKTPIDTFESAAFYNVRAKDNAATELHLHEQVPAQIKNNAFMRHDPPYTKVYIPDNYENWLDVIEEDKNHILIRKADFQNRGWTQNKHSSVGGWDGITKIMANDTSMCKKDGSGNSAVFEVFDKHVIGFAFVYGTSGGGCWILKKPETGFKVIVR